ncbi:hypothetical protein D3C81_1450260 [compost metagenome]
MVVPGDDPRRGQVRALQVAVALVLRVAGAVVVQRKTFMRAHGPARMLQLVRSPFINVIAEEGHQVGRGCRDVPVRRIGAEFPVLARGDGQFQRGRHGAGRGRRARAAHGTDGVAKDKPVPVPAPGRETAGVDVHAVREGGHGRGLALGGDAAKRLVFGHFPAHGQGDGGRGGCVQRVVADACPQHDGVGQGRTGSDTERKRIAGAIHARGGTRAGTGQHAAGRGQCRDARSALQENAALAIHGVE